MREPIKTPVADRQSAQPVRFYGEPLLTPTRRLQTYPARCTARLRSSVGRQRGDRRTTAARRALAVVKKARRHWDQPESDIAVHRARYRHQVQTAVEAELALTLTLVALGVKLPSVDLA